MFKYRLVYENGSNARRRSREFKAESDQKALEKMMEIKKKTKGFFFARKLSCVDSKGQERMIIQLDI